jgi:DNA-binding response OmpR family regulator
MMNVKDGQHRLLLIAHDPADATLVREALADARDGLFKVEWVTQLSDGLERLSRTGVAAVLLDLAMPDSPGIASFEQVLRAAPDIPILVLRACEEISHKGHEVLATKDTKFTKVLRFYFVIFVIFVASLFVPSWPRFSRTSD